ncbi:hypothetical protein [Calothrix sp. 336/3]|uniref:hypothetical protein n=1 Tax=Calothrix sp. 336/3 TaxID=1337936 RepID=UPI000AECE2C5|nr:hypothetical protein [Calothrix sp. 336/3]
MWVLDGDRVCLCGVWDGDRVYWLMLVLGWRSRLLVDAGFGWRSHLFVWGLGDDRVY